MENKKEYSLQELAYIHAERYKKYVVMCKDFVEKTPDMNREYFDDHNNLPDINLFGTPAQFGSPFYLDRIQFPKEMSVLAREIINDIHKFQKKAIHEAMPELEGKFNSWFQFHNAFCWPHHSKDAFEEPYIAPNGAKISQKEFYDRFTEWQYLNRQQYIPIVEKMAKFLDGAASFLESVK